jgi:CRP/FNR family transcriptional regulator, anaerobic regulatory protein
MPESKLIQDYLTKSFPSFEKKLKEHISAEGTLKTYNAGDLLPNKKNYLNSIWLLAQGNVKIYYEGPEGKEVFLYIVGPGEACALSMMIRGNEDKEIKARAMEKTVVVQVPLKSLEDFMQKYTTWNQFMLGTFKEGFDSLLGLVENVKFRALEARLEKYLKETVAKLGSRQLTITHQEIANDLNSSREVVTRLLKKMEQKGMLKYNRHYLEWLG